MLRLESEIQWRPPTFSHTAESHDRQQQDAAMSPEGPELKLAYSLQPPIAGTGRFLGSKALSGERLDRVSSSGMPAAPDLRSSLAPGSTVAGTIGPISTDSSDQHPLIVQQGAAHAEQRTRVNIIVDAHGAGRTVMLRLISGSEGGPPVGQVEWRR